MRFTLTFIAASILSCSALAQTTSPHTDKDREIADLKRQVGSLQGQLRTLRNGFNARSSAKGDLQKKFDAMQKQVDALTRAVKSLQANSILDLNGYLTLDYSTGYPTALFRGINVQVVNGMGSTQTANGLGNLVVGYNKPRTGPMLCSLGWFSNESECTAQGGIWASNHKSGSHNIVGGDFGAYSMWGGLLLGMENAIVAPYATVTAGASNIASGDLSSVMGGSFNISNAMYATVGGGLSNVAGAPFSSVGGGSTRKTDRTYNWKAGNLTQEQ